MGEKQQQDDCVIHPRREKGEKQLPVKGIFLPNPTEARFATELLKKKEGARRPFFHSNLTVSHDGDFFVAGPAVGAPMATLCLEKLIALGAGKVVLLSCCGGIAPSLRIGDILLPDRSFSGEGTSTYYFPDKSSRPDPDTVKDLEKFLAGKGMNVHGGAIWSTDAPYRESRTELKKLHLADGVTGVDMEFSALCAVAAFRQITLAAVFVVSDLLFASGQWQSGFSAESFRVQSREIINQFIQDRCRCF